MKKGETRKLVLEVFQIRAGVTAAGKWTHDLGIP